MGIDLKAGGRVKGTARKESNTTNPSAPQPLSVRSDVNTGADEEGVVESGKNMLGSLVGLPEGRLGRRDL